MNLDILIIHTPNTDLPGIKKELQKIHKSIVIQCIEKTDQNLKNSSINEADLIIMDCADEKCPDLKSVKELKSNPKLKYYPLIILIDCTEDCYSEIDPKPDAIVYNEDAKRELVNLVNVMLRLELAESKLDMVERRLSTLFMNLPGMVYSCKNDKHWTMTFLSDGCLDVTGYECNDLLNNAKISYNSIIHADDRKLVRESVKKALRAKDVFNVTYRINCAEGNVKWVWEQGQGHFDRNGNLESLEGYISDITTSVIAQNALKENEEKYRKLIDFSPSGIIIINDNSELIFTNRKFAEITGYTNNEILELKFFDLVHDDSKDTVIKRYRDRQLGKKVPVEYTLKIVAKDKSVKDLLINATIIDIDEDIKHTLVQCQDITKQLQIQNRVKENERKYVDLVENSLEGIYVIKDKKVVYCNNHFAEIFGFAQAKEMIGVKIESLIHPDDFPLVKEKIRLREEGKAKSAHYEFRGTKIDGTPIILETLGGTSIYNEQTVIQGVMRDVTDKKASEDMIRKLSRAVEQSPVTIVITDIKGDIEYVNPKFIESSGFTSEEVIGKNANIVKSGYTSDNEYKNLWRTITSGKVWRGEFLNKKKNGEYFWELASISPIKNKKGEITHFIGFKEDITERKEMEKEVIKAKERAEESDKLKTSFLANMSHEIRTPMNAIMGFSSLLSDDSLTSEERVEFVDLINSNSKNLLTLIDDIIDIAKIEAGQLKILKKDFNINEVLKEICMTYQKVKSKESKEHLELLFDVENSSDLDLIHTDAHRLRQVIANLVGNAIKYTISGSIKFGYKLISDINSDQSEQKIQFFVKDTGIGIPPEKIKVIFERFRQADDSHTRIFGGTGLGLAISQNIAKLLGGDIQVVSKVDKGSVFYLTIPYEKPKKVKQESFKSIEKKQQLDWSNKTVLIAEDVDSNYHLISTLLKRTKINMIWAKNGQKAIEEYDKSDKIDIILMDMQMPVLNGYEATRSIKSLNSEIPIIAVTAFALEGDKEKIMDAGCDDYISKPIKSEVLISLMNSYLK